MPVVAAKLASRALNFEGGDSSSREEKKAVVVLPFRAFAPVELEEQTDLDVSTIYADLFEKGVESGLPLHQREEKKGSRAEHSSRYPSLYEKNLAQFSERHPLDRFEACFNRLAGRYSPREIHNRLVKVHCDIIAAGHKDKYQGIAGEYLPRGDHFRRIVAAFLLMSFSMQREMLAILLADGITAT